MSEVDADLLAASRYLDIPLRGRLRELLGADSLAHEVVDLRGRTQRAEDLAAECKRQLRSRNRECDHLREKLAALTLASPSPGVGAVGREEGER